MRDLMRRLSGNQHSAPPQDGPLKAAAAAAGGGPPPVRPEDTPDALTAEVKYRDAQRLAAEGRWGSALDTLNKVLVLQRKSLGQDHRDAGRTLNDIGVALMNLGRYFPAQTALKEAQYIREEALGCGAPEVAETLTNLAILMDKVNAAETEAHEREEKREVVRRKSFGSLADGGIDGNAVAKMQSKFDSSLSDFEGYGDSDTESDDDYEGRDGGDDEEKRQIMDELQRLEERREQMRLMSMQMAADRKRLSMEHMAQRQVQTARRRGSGSQLGFGASLNASKADLEKEIFSGGARRRKSGGSLALGLNAMDAAKAAAAAARGEDVNQALRRRPSASSLSGLSVDAAMGFFDDDSDSDDDDEIEPEPRHRRRPSLGALSSAFGGGGGGDPEPEPRPRRRPSLGALRSAFGGEPEPEPEPQPRPRRRPSFRPLGGAFGGGEEAKPEAALPRPRSFDHLSMGAAIAGQVDLRTQIRNDHGGKPKKRLSGGILSSAISAFADDTVGSEDERPKTYKDLQRQQGPAVDLREQIRQEHDRPKRRFSNGLLSKRNEIQGVGDGGGGGHDSGDDMDYMREQMREKMVFSGS